MRIVLLGSGNVATYLGTALKKKGHSIIQVFSRNKKSASELAGNLKCNFTTTSNKIAEDADLYIVSVSDDAIEPVLRKLRFIPKIIVHTSGSVSIDVFPKSMTNCGVVYPLQSFSKSSKTNELVVPFCIEASNRKTKALIKKLATSIGDKVYEVNSDKRLVLHLAAVFVNNFTNHLLTLSSEFLSENKLNFKMMLPLLELTIKRAVENSPATVQTGPARRGDKKVIERHLKLLGSHPAMKDIYNAMSKSIWQYYLRRK